MLDAVILSDLHLGSDNCQARQLCELLEGIADESPQTARIILNGDVFDSIDFRRLKKTHWKVLSLIRKLSDRLEIVWICGNHDGSAEIVSHLLGVRVEDEYVLTSGGRRVLLFHGHIYDDFLDNHPILSWFGDCIYALLQWIDRTHHLAKVAKKGSKTFLRCAKKIEEQAIARAARQDCEAVCCGHTHHAVVNTGGPVHYFNSGCWTERPCTYLTIEDGLIELHTFQPTDEASNTFAETEVDAVAVPQCGEGSRLAAHR
jgi:UDP-2,3-diacylglucosamine pyrophosphatase LpxH